jgi:hypothetical protein
MTHSKNELTEMDAASVVLKIPLKKLLMIFLLPQILFFKYGSIIKEKP